MLINGTKFACNTCVKGHRSSNCNHIDRPLFEIRKKGRPVTQCSFCRDLRKTRQIHIKCSCTDKTKGIEGLATTAQNQQQQQQQQQQYQQQQQCYQCPSAKNLLSEDHSIAYSDLIQNSSDMDGQEPVIPAPSSSRCTCHETAIKLLNMNKPKEGNWNSTQQKAVEMSILPSRSRGIAVEENVPGPYSFQKSTSSSSLRFLGGHTKSPRRRSSLSRRSSTSSSRRSTISQPTPAFPINEHILSQQQEQDNLMMDMQSFLMTDGLSQQQQQQQQQITERESESVAANSQMTAFYNVSSASSASSNLSSHSPNSAHADMVADYAMSDSNTMEGFIMTDPDELTALLNNVLMESTSEAINKQKKSNSAIDMTRTTTSSSTSSSKINQFTTQPVVCGSLVPHSGCPPASINQQGESVVITITPLSNIREQEAAKSKPTTTRIVTCYYGSSCMCPGCFVHPNNFAQFNLQHPFQSNTSSLYSSDDEDLSQSVNNKANHNYL